MQFARHGPGSCKNHPKTTKNQSFLTGSLELIPGFEPGTSSLPRDPEPMVPGWALHHISLYKNNKATHMSVT